MIEEWIKCIGMSIIVLIIYVPLRYKYLKNKHKSLFCKDELIKALFIIYIISVLEILLIPKLNILIYTENERLKFECIPIGNFSSRNINLIPFKTLKAQFSGAGNHIKANLFANIMIMMPMPILIKLINKKIKNIFPLIITLIIIVIIEFIQYFIGRSCDIDDIILNFCGALISYSIFFLINTISDKRLLK